MKNQYVFLASVVLGVAFLLTQCTDDEALNSAILEHFNIFCCVLGRREDEAGKEEDTVILKYREYV